MELPMARSIYGRVSLGWLTTFFRVVAAAIFILVTGAQHSIAQSWSISPSSTSVSESAGSVTFTVTRSSGNAAQTVYVSTTQTEGYTNSNDYVGITSQALA